MADLKTEVSELNSSIKELVDAWKAATGLLKFVRILGIVAASVSAIYAFIPTKGLHL